MRQISKQDMGIKYLNIIIVGILQLIIVGSCVSQKQPLRDNGVNNYQDSLMFILHSIENGNQITDQFLIYSIPKNLEQSKYFFSLDYNKNTSSSFQQLYSELPRRCMEGNPDLIRKYLKMSTYVDGYFAESYFDSIEPLMAKKGNIICKIAKQIPKVEIERLRDILSSCFE